MSLVLRKWIRSAVIGTRKFTKPIAVLGHVEELPTDNELHGQVKLGLISDKDNCIRAIFTRDSLVKYEEKGCTLNNMRGMIISLQDYAILANIGVDRRYSEFMVEIYKFNIVSEERHRMPHVKDINQDETAQSKLAQKWRDRQLSRDINDSNCLVLYSQMEESQLSQDHLSQLLSIMNASSQVYSCEAISSSQQIELSNLSGWMLKSEQCLDEASQDTTYATPQLDAPMDREQGDESDDTMTYKTPPQGIASPPVSTTDRPTVQSNAVSTSAPQSELPSLSQEQSELPLPSEEDSTHIAVEQVKDLSQLLQNSVHEVSVRWSKPVAECVKILNSQRAGSGSEKNQTNEQEEAAAAASSPAQANELSQFCEMSSSQVADMDDIWNTQHQPSQCNTNTNQCNESQRQPYTDNLPTSATPNNHVNAVDNTTSVTPQTAKSNQRQLSSHQPASPKGKGGTTKDIHLTDGGKKHPTTIHALHDHITSVSESQQDELDEQWWEDEACYSDPSSLEVFDDIHPFQLESCEVATQQEPVNTSDIPVQSNIVIGDNSCSLRLNQGDSKASRLRRKRRREVSLDQLDQQLLDLATDSEDETIVPPIQTSLVSTELITRLLNVSDNKTSSANAAVSKKATGNTHVTFSQVVVEHSYHKRRSRSKSPEGVPSSSKEPEQLFSDSEDNVSIDVGSPEYVTIESDESNEMEDQGFWCNFKPLRTETEIDDFIDTYWARQRLRNMSFYRY